MNKRTAWKLVAIILTAVSGVLGSIAYQAQHATSLRTAISGVAKGAQDRIRTARASLDSLAAADTAREVYSLRFEPPSTLGRGLHMELVARDLHGQEQAAVWTSTDTTVLQVDEYGRVAAIGPGVATIIAEVRSGVRVRTTLTVPDDP